MKENNILPVIAIPTRHEQTTINFEGQIVNKI